MALWAQSAAIGGVHKAAAFSIFSFAHLGDMYLWEDGQYIRRLAAVETSALDETLLCGVVVAAVQRAAQAVLKIAAERIENAR